MTATLRLIHGKKWAAFGIAGSLLAWLAIPAGRETIRATTPVAAAAEVGQPPPADNRSLQLYLQHCADCHGEKGDSLGPAAKQLEPRPRNLRDYRYRLISSSTVPLATMQDVRDVLDRGMPGSAMPSWAHLPEEDRMLLVGQVLQFRKDGARDRSIAALKEEGEDATEDAIKKQMEKFLPAAGPPLMPADLGQPTPESIARGKELFQKGCASCHGANGKGDGVEKMLTSEGYVQRPRDLTRGIYKGAHDPIAVYRRLKLGLPGSSMPGNPQVSHQDLADMTHFCLSLSDEATRNSYVARRQAITAKKVDQIPAPGASGWANGTELVVFPLWWRDFDNPHLNVQAVHDGKSLAVRMTWKDASENRLAYDAAQFEDMAALQLFQGKVEPFLGMGSKDGQVEMWLWRGSWGQRPDPSNHLLDDYPFDMPLYKEVVKNGKAPPPNFLTAAAAGNQHAGFNNGLTASQLEARGFGSTTFRPQMSQQVKATAEWKQGQWTVVLVRPLQVDGGLPLASGERRSIAFAIWDGKAQDRNGQKLITIWQDLVLE